MHSDDSLDGEFAKLTAPSLTIATLSDRARFAWRIAQALSLTLGVGEIVLLLWNPTLGIHLLWNLLIPLAPLVVMLVPGIWRNVCPLSVASQLPRRLGVQARRRLSQRGQIALIAIGWVALLLIVPMRHPWFDRSGVYTAMILLALGSAAVLLGLLLDGKSGWCSTICPVHIVEKLYGQRPLLRVRNAHCDSCTRCVTICPDRDPGPNRLLKPNGNGGRASSRNMIGHLMIGGFAGYVFGWFQCPDFSDPTVANVAEAYAWTLGGMTVSVLAYVLLLRGAGVPREPLSRIFAAAAIAFYYWYRIPMLLGFGGFGLDGCLIGLSTIVPPAAVTSLQVGVVLLVVAWLAVGLLPAKPWMAPVPVAANVRAQPIY